MPPPAIRYDGAAVDLSTRFFKTAAVVASPAAATETIIASVTLDANVSMQEAVQIWGWAAFTGGTNGVGANLRIRRTDASGTAIAASGAVTVVATKLYAPAISAFDTGATIPGQVYVMTLEIASGSAESTVSAVSLTALVI